MKGSVDEVSGHYHIEFGEEEMEIVRRALARASSESEAKVDFVRFFGAEKGEVCRLWNEVEKLCRPH